MSLTLRPATMADAELLREWRNDPETRAASGNPNEVLPEEHRLWMEKILSPLRLDIPYTGLYVAEVDGVPVGTGRIERAYVRINVKLDTARLSYTISPAYRGRGYGKQLVAALVEQAHGMGYTTIACRIKRGNTRSVVLAMCGGVNSIEFF